MGESELARGQASLLAAFGGKRPPAPRWFNKALAREPCRSTFEQDGVEIELLTWGEVGKPGLLFLHGNAAHADWWSFIAPYFAEDHRCAAISWSGMGGSGWRSAYSIDGFAREALKAIDVAELAHSGLPPTLIGHSFGSFPLLYLAAEHADRLLGAVLIDALGATCAFGEETRTAVIEGRCGVAAISESGARA